MISYNYTDHDYNTELLVFMCLRTDASTDAYTDSMHQSRHRSLSLGSGSHQSNFGPEGIPWDACYAPSV